MTPQFDARKLRLAQQIAEQRRWLDEHGGDAHGYIARYGNPGLPHCYGDGGSAIYHADQGALVRLERELALLP